MLRLILSTIALAVASTFSSYVFAQSSDPIDYIKQATVYLDFEVIKQGDPKTDMDFGQPASAQGTGFLIDTDGHVVTTFHNLKQLEPYDKNPGRINILAKVGDIHAAPRPAFVEDSDESKDLLILRIDMPPGHKPVFISNSSRDAVSNNNRDVCGFGLFRGQLMHEPCGRVTSFKGPVPNTFLWTTNFKFGKGLSGGPVYLEGNGTVVGIIKGRVDVSDADIGLVVPMWAVRSMLPELPTLETVEISSAPEIDPTTLQPKKIENAILSFATTEKVEKREAKTEKFYRRNKHCERSRPIRWEIKPQAEFQIDPTSVKLNVTTQSSNTPRPHLEVSENSIIIAGAIVNNGKCVKVFGDVVARDGRGALGVSVDFDEVRYVTKETLEEKSIDISIGSEVIAEIPKDARDIILSYDDKGIAKLVTEAQPSDTVSFSSTRANGEMIIRSQPFGGGTDNNE